MSRQARRFERKSNTRVRKVIGESGHQPKQKFVEDRGERAKVVMPTPKNHNQKLLISALNTDIMVLVNGSAGTGKAQPLGSSILTIDGWVKMGDLQVGDFVRSTNSWAKVSAIYPQGKKEVVRFYFKDGGVVECCTEHLWTVNNGISKCRSTVETISAKTLMELLDKPKKSGRNVSVNVPDAIELPEHIGAIRPYTMGVLLGDGCFRGLTPTICTGDPEIFDRVARELPSDMVFGMDGGRKNTKSIRHIGSGFGGNRFTNELKSFGLHGKYSQEKFIPESYKFSSVENRYDLLQGMLDTDGTVGKQNGTVTLSTSSYQMAQDARDVVLSLGGKASISLKKPVYTYKGEKLAGLDNYVVSISVPDKKRLFSLARKKDLVGNVDIKQLRRVFSHYELVGEKECQCISVEHPSHLYITDDYVLTHNTYVVLAHAAKQLLEKKVEKIVLYRPYQPLANRTVGFLKGTANEKMMPFFAQQVAYLEQFLGKNAVAMAIENGTIELGLMEAARGRSFENAIVVIDESQLLTPAEAQALSTRIGDNCQVVFVGDSNQRDDRKKDSGLSYLERIVSDYMIEDVGIIKFTANDIVRSGITKAFVKAFDQEGYL